MLIQSADDLIIATESLCQTAKDEIRDFIYAVSAADNAKTLITLYPEVEMKGDDVIFLVKTNEQHVAACVGVTFTQDDDIKLTVQSYD